MTSRTRTFEEYMRDHGLDGGGEDGQRELDLRPRRSRQLSLDPEVLDLAADDADGGRGGDLEAMRRAVRGE